MNKEYWEELEKQLYQINRGVSLNVGFEKDIKEQHKLMLVNTMIGEAIKVARADAKDIGEFHNDHLKKTKEAIQNIRGRL